MFLPQSMTLSWNSALPFVAIEVSCRRCQARTLNVMWTSNYVSLKYLQGSLICCATLSEGIAISVTWKQTAKRLPHHSASSRSWVQLFRPIFPFSQCICQDSRSGKEDQSKWGLRRTKADPNLWPKLNIKPNETLEVCKCSWNISTSCSPVLYL